MNTTTDARHQLNRIGDRIAWLTTEIDRAEAVRDSLVRELSD